MAGVSKFIPIINPPQAANLGVGTIKKKYTTDAAGNLKYETPMRFSAKDFLNLQFS